MTSTQQSIRDNTSKLYHRCIILRNQLEESKKTKYTAATTNIFLKSLNLDINILHKIQSANFVTKKQLLQFLKQQKPYIFQIFTLANNIITTDYNKYIKLFSQHYPKGTRVYIIDSEDISASGGSQYLTILKNALIKYGYIPYTVTTTDTTASAASLGRYVIGQVLAKPWLESLVLGSASPTLDDGTNLENTGVANTILSNSTSNAS